MLLSQMFILNMYILYVQIKLCTNKIRVCLNNNIYDFFNFLKIKSYSF